jgi:hypothetical protein
MNESTISETEGTGNHVKMDRRAFLKGALVAGAAAASGVALAGCAPSESGGTEGGGSNGGATTSGSSERVAGYCGPGDWLGTAPEIAESDITVAGDYDIVILGSGHAGVGAAFSAIDEGLSTAVIEQQPWSAFVPDDGSNGGGWYGCYIGHVNSKFLIEHGYGPYNTGEIVTEFTKRGGGRVMPDIIRTFVQNSGPMFDRYHEIYDMYEAERKANDSNVFLKDTTVVINGEPVPDEGYFDQSNMFEFPMCNIQTCALDVTYPLDAGGYKTWPGVVMFWGYQANGIEWVHKYIVKYAQDNGAEYFFEHTGVKLVTDASGVVTGLIAQDAEGNYKQFNASKGVLLASGDFVGNPEMCWALLNEGMEWAERAGSTAEDWSMAGSRAGAGHKMACWLGAMIEPSPRGWMSMGGGVGGPWGNAPLLQLDENGERMYNEASIPQMYPTNLRLVSPAKCWVSDANWKETVGRAPLDHGAPDYGQKDFWTDQVAQMDALTPGPEPTFIIGSNLAERKQMGGDVFCANTLDELADYLGYADAAKQTFLASIKHYNELCKSEMGDTDFGKEKSMMISLETPPFYGGVAGGGFGGAPHTATPMMVTMSGLLTDKHQNVLSKDWQTIKGLYACGNTLGGRFGMGYTTPFSGCSVGMAMTHGYTAAKIIAKL